MIVGFGTAWASTSCGVGGVGSANVGKQPLVSESAIGAVHWSGRGAKSDETFGRLYIPLALVERRSSGHSGPEASEVFQLKSGKPMSPN